MAEDKLLKDKKTKEVKDNIYALDLDFDNNETINPEEETKTADPVEEVFFKGYGNIDLEENEEETNKKKKLSKIEEGIKSSKRGRGRPRKDSTSVAKTTKKVKTNQQSEIKMHTENNLTEIKLKYNIYKIELQKNEYNIYT